MFLRVKEKYVELFLWVIDGVIPKTEKRNGYLVNKENTESILFGTRLLIIIIIITTISQHYLLFYVSLTLTLTFVLVREEHVFC